MYCKPDIDIFASSINYQTGQCASWHPDRNAIAIDAFSISWSELNFYLFLPFILIGVAIAKVRQEKCSGILILTWWKMIITWWILISYHGIITENFPDTSSSKYTDCTIQKISEKSTLSENEIISLSFLRKSFGNTNLQSYISDVITDSWRTTT